MIILLATGNAHKIREIQRLLNDGQGLEIQSLKDYPNLELPEETESTMAGNARLKAEHCAHETGLISLADDSGIEVDALNGAPGVYSARWVPGSDEDRTQALLDKLKDTPDEKRTARYRCVICVASLDSKRSSELKFFEAEGTCEGKITYAPRGSNGFGYDPIFEITEATGTTRQWIGKTMGEVPDEVKASVSHRARAVAVTKPYLLQFD